MRDTTKAFLDRVRTVDLFSRVGAAFADVDTIHAEGWAQAAHIADTRQNDNLRLEAANELCASIPRREFNATWNTRVEAIKPITMHVVDRALAAVRPPEAAVDAVRNTANWDILHAAMEHEFDVHDRAKFFRGLMHWYFRGHFVCGWDCSQGYFRLIVF